MLEATAVQKDAIETLDRNLLVSAGAGSGKTTVLVNRFLRMVGGANGKSAPGEQRVPVDGVLTITFTDKAAGEMRERIAAALMRGGLVEERRQLEVAYISTIHGFCRRLLQENPFEAALDPKFTTLDNAQAILLRDTCFEGVVEAAFARGDEELVGLLLAYQDAPDMQAADDPLAGLRKPILAPVDSMRSLGWAPADLQRWVDEGAEGILSQVATSLREPLAEAWEQARGLAAPLRDLRLSGPAEEARVALDQWARNATPIVKGESLASLAARAAELRALRPSTMVPRARREYDAHAYSVMKEALPQIRAIIDGSLIQGIDLAREEAAARYGAALLRLGLAVWRAYDAAKEEASALDFNDLQLRARQLLEQSAGVRRRYQRKFRYVMVDEFQDTDRLQKGIIDLLRGEGNFFVVGDVKQSIYGWRNADVRLFLALDREFTAKERLKPEQFRRLSLVDNFRSRPEILAFVNGVFQDLWAPGHDGTPAAVPFERLQAQGTFDAKEEPSVELLLVSRSGSVEERRTQEAEAIALRLKELHGALPLTSARRKAPRARWSDFLILLRGLTQVSLYEDALVRHGIPYFVVGGRGYYARREIRDLVCLLRVIGSPLDDVAAAAVLRSPFVGVSLDTLLLLSHASRAGGGYPCLLRAIPTVLENEEVPEEDRDALRRFDALLAKLRRNADRLKPGWLLDQALGESHYEARVLAGHDGRRRLANVRKLVQMANSFAAPDVAALVRHLESLSTVSTDEGDAPSYSEASDVVRIMTVHKAKGLEAPVVILPDLGRSMMRRSADLVAANPEERLVGMKVPEAGDWNGAAALSLLAERKAAREQAEEERLLYVALTRAQEHLLLVGPIPPGSGTWGEWLYGGRVPVLAPPTSPTNTELPGIEDVAVRVSGFSPA